VRALALTSEARDAELPDVPTMAESGYPAVTSTSFTGVVAPAGTPREVVTILNVRLNDLLQLPEVQARMRSLGLVPKGGTPEEFAAFAATERQKWARIAKAAGASAN
jgi:tripartite-type tricarboxylate transporter receptor subunit TctC